MTRRRPRHGPRLVERESRRRSCRGEDCPANRGAQLDARVSKSKVRFGSGRHVAGTLLTDSGIGIRPPLRTDRSHIYAGQSRDVATGRDRRDRSREPPFENDVNRILLYRTRISWSCGLHDTAGGRVSCVEQSRRLGRPNDQGPGRRSRDRGSPGRRGRQRTVAVSNRERSDTVSRTCHGGNGPNPTTSGG